MAHELEQLEALVRAGHFDRVRAQLKLARARRIARGEAVAYANLARRVGLGELSLRILNPIVRPEKGGRRVSAIPATPVEKAEYAASLRNLGAIPEAAEILEGIDPEAFPGTLFQQALCRIQKWEYAAAVPLLEQYVAMLNAADYARQVARVNLLSALIHESALVEARRLMNALLGELKAEGNALLFRNTLELAARLEIASENWDEARKYLDWSGKNADASGSAVDALLVQKWRAVSESLRQGRPRPGLERVRARAIAERHWETVRDCDYYLGRLASDPGRLHRVFFGTPFSSFRLKVAQSLGGLERLPENYDWPGLDSRSNSADGNFDLLLARGEVRGSSSLELVPGQEIHALLIFLCRDFYRPAPLLSIFSRLFPEDYFNPDSSPNRVHHVVSRLRHWFVQGRIPVDLAPDPEGYRMEFRQPFVFRIPREPLDLRGRELELRRLRALLEPRPGSAASEGFTMREAVDRTEVSAATVKRLLKWAVDQGKLIREGRTHRTRYRFVPVAPAR